jgi:multidrug efflux pump subunit AcrA (membrane-fusion protein)
MIYVSPVVDAASGLQEVKALFENAGGVIRPGVAGVLMVGQDGAEVIRENHE